MNTVLVTGATGAIGSALVPLFLNSEDTSVKLLLRAGSQEQLRQRLNGLLRFWGVNLHDSRLVGRIEAVRGDVCAPRLGLQEEVHRELAADVTHFVHAAGNVKLNQSLDEARRNAVEATRHVLAFAQQCRRSGRFQKLEFVSTVGVAGAMPGLVPERPLPGPRRFHNTYEAAKAEAEALLLEEMGRGLPATIHRPSMVVGDSHTGKVIHFQVFYHLTEFLCGARTWGIVPRTGTRRLDIIPVDYVARAIHRSSARQEAAGRIFHLCSGPRRAPRLAELTDLLRELLLREGRRLPPLRPVRLAWFRAILPLVRRVGPRATRRAIQGLRFFLAYLDEEQAFDDTLARDFFGPAGLSVGPVAEYLPNVMRYYGAVKSGTPCRPDAAEAAG
jgi:thioester reductase-like protein